MDIPKGIGMRLTDEVKVYKVENSLIALQPLWGLCVSSYTAVQLHKVRFWLEIRIKNLSLI